MRQFDGPILAGLLEAAPDAMVCVDPDGRIVLVNAQAERLFGYPREELTGQPVEILVPDAIKAAHPALRAGYATDPRPRQMGAGLDLSGRRRDGTTFPAEIALSALDTDQGLLVSAAIRDVTEQRQDATISADQPEPRNPSPTPWRTTCQPLSLAPSLYSTVLIEDYADTLGEDGRSYAQRIEAASEHMGRIVDDLAAHVPHLPRAQDRPPARSISVPRRPPSPPNFRVNKRQQGLLHYPGSHPGAGRCRPHP